MADNLTVETRGAGPAAPRGSASDDGAAAERAELEKLRDLAKAKHGKALNERTLKAILQRRKAKHAQRQKTAENKEAFAKEQAKEKVSSRAQDAQVRAQKTTGAREARGADGLTSEDRQSVRSDPKAGPKLPPTQAKATTPEKANELLGLMLASVQIEGEVFDLDAYARTLKQAPPSKPKDAPEQGKQPARTEQGRQAGQQARPARAQQPAGQQAPKAPLAQKSSGLSSTNQGSTNQKATPQDSGMPTTARPGATQRGGSKPGAAGRAGGPGTRQPAATPGKAGGQGTTPGRAGPTPTPMASQTTSPSGALGMPTSSAKLGFRAGASDTRLTSTNVSDDGLFNAGGGLITNSSFDGMHFNWDAFFSLFLIRSQKDMQEWRKLMKELRRLEGELALQGYKTDIALTKMRQHFERKKEFRKGATAFAKAREAFHKGQVRAVSGHDPSRVGETTQQMRDFVERTRKQGHEIRGGPHLTESQIKSLPQELQKEYRNLRTGLRMDGGINAEYEMALNTYNARNQEPKLTSAECEELHNELSALEREKNQLTGRMMRDPVQAAVLNEQRNAMQDREKQLLEGINDLREKKNEHEKGTERLGKEELAEVESKLSSLQKERFGLLRRMMILDWTMARTEPRREGQTKAYGDVIEKTVTAERGPVRNAVEAIDDELRYMEANANETDEQCIDRLEKRLAELRQDPQVVAFEAELKKQVRDSPEVAAFEEQRERVRSLKKGSPEAKEAWDRFRELRDDSTVQEYLTWRAKQYKKTPGLAKVDQIEHMRSEAREHPNESKEQRRERLTTERGRIVGGIGPHWSPAFRAGDNALRDREEYLRRLVDGDPTSGRPGGQGESTWGGSPIERFMKRTTEGDVDMDALASDTRDLAGIVNAGRHIQEARRDYVHDLKLDNRIERVGDAIEAFAGAVDKSFGKAVNKAVQGAIGMAKRHRKEVDGEIRAVSQRAQGMINQLVQLLGVSRSR